MVYRSLNKPMGRVNVPENQLYSIRGYFIPAAGSGYQFITHIPLRQYWYIDSMVCLFFIIHIYNTIYFIYKHTDSQLTYILYNTEYKTYIYFMYKSILYSFIIWIWSIY